MYVSSTENASRFPFIVFAYMINSVTSEADFNFGYKWKDFDNDYDKGKHILEESAQQISSK